MYAIIACLLPKMSTYNLRERGLKKEKWGGGWGGGLQLFEEGDYMYFKYFCQGGEGGRLFEGDNYFKYFGQRGGGGGAIFRGR